MRHHLSRGAAAAVAGESRTGKASSCGDSVSRPVVARGPSSHSGGTSTTAGFFLASSGVATHA